MIEFKKKPVYTPPSKVRDSLYTAGKEYMYVDTLEEYQGLYHTYPNDAIYSEAQYQPHSSRPLIAYVNQSTPVPVLDDRGNDIGESTFNNSMYYRITEKRFNNHYQPPYYYPEPSPELYDVGYMVRFFAQKINDTNDITEITPDEFDRKNKENNPGIDEGIYNFVKVQWTIDGPIKDVRSANARVITYAEDIENFKRLSKYLSDLDEFHKNKHKVPE